MIREITVDGIYRPIKSGNHWLVDTHINVRGKINRVIYSEPMRGDSGHMKTEVVFFPNLMSAENKCDQLNNIHRDPFGDWKSKVESESQLAQRKPVPDFIGYHELAPEAGTV